GIAVPVDCTNSLQTDTRFLQRYDTTADPSHQGGAGEAKAGQREYKEARNGGEAALGAIGSSPISSPQREDFRNGAKEEGISETTVRRKQEACRDAKREVIFDFVITDQLSRKE